MAWASTHSLLAKEPKLPSLQQIYSPSPISRPYQESVFLDQNWNEALRFIFNRGPDAVSYLKEVQKFLSPAEIRKIKGFTSFDKVRVNLIGYEIRSREVLDSLSALLDEGSFARIVTDSSTMTPVQYPTDEIWNSWTREQKRYFNTAYDWDGDGRTSTEDLKHVNAERYQAILTWKKLEELQKKYPKQVELIKSPVEIVPAKSFFNYPRLHHMKEISIQFTKNPNSRAQGWADPVRSMETSANATDSCLDQRVAQDPRNIEAYVNGEPAKRVESSEGHIQFGAVFEIQEMMKAVRGPLEEWIDLYKRGEHFDARKIDSEQGIRVVTKDGSVLQAFFSEGMQPHEGKKIDPIWAITQILARKDIKIKTYYDGEFVWTHKAYSRHLRSILSHHPIENFALYVDGSQALETYSALPDLTFAPTLRQGAGVFKGKGIQDFAPFPENLDWRKNIMIYRGGPNFLKRNMDKAHLKARYIEFEDAMGVMHYVVGWGSANTSYNAGQLNADVFYIFESTDPEVAKQIRPFFESLREDPRMQAYDLAYLERFLSTHFLFTTQLFDEKYLQKLSDYLLNGGSVRTYRSLLGRIQEAGARTEQGAHALKLMEWFEKYNQELNWDDLYIIQVLTDPESHKGQNFLRDLADLWLESIPKNKTRFAKTSLNRRMMEVLDDNPMPEQISKPKNAIEKARMKIQGNCGDYIGMIEGKVPIERRRFPIANVSSN